MSETIIHRALAHDLQTVESLQLYRNHDFETWYVQMFR